MTSLATAMALPSHRFRAVARKYDLAGHTDGTPATPISSQRESRLISCRSPSQHSAISEPAFRKLHTTHLPSSPHTVVQQLAINEQPAFHKLHTTHLPSSPDTVVEVSYLPPYAAPASLRTGPHTGQPPFAAATARVLSTRPCRDKGQVRVQISPPRFLQQNP